jgi:hypothetical protein
VSFPAGSPSTFLVNHFIFYGGILHPVNDWRLQQIGGFSGHTATIKHNLVA